MAVKIRMKKMGANIARSFASAPSTRATRRDGRVLEELGTYDPMVNDSDARALLKSERITYWLGVGAQPSDRVRVLIKKYGAGGTHVEQQRAARERLALPKIVPDAGVPVYVPPAEGSAPAEAAEAAETPPASESPEPEASAAE